ncbi:MAG: peptide chain release factor-like protein, partial [Desulfobacula sp.]|nr:peptide chain release factor-like protein [Desulfobacula sp.]
MTGPGKDKLFDLEKRMKALGIKKEDVEEKVIKASGRGG